MKRLGLLKLLIGPVALAGVLFACVLWLGVPLRPWILIPVVWGLFNLGGIFDAALRHSDVDKRLIPFIRRTLRTTVLVGSGVYVASIYGFDVSTWLAGAGIAGLAVSLAAQDTLKNLFGSLAVFFDRPFKLGDRIKYGNITGVVMDIGFRTTKIRESGGSVVAIPNSRIANAEIENISARKFIKRSFDLSIIYGADMSRVVQVLREVVEESCQSSMIDGVTYRPRIYFNNIGSDNLNVGVTYWYTPPSWWSFQAHAEQLNLKIIERFKAEKIEFAFPTQTIHVSE